MSILGNNLLAQHYAQNQGLPFGYEAVEYLESTGTQYIDTGVVGSNLINVDTLVTLKSSSSAYFIFGSRVAFQNKAIALSYIYNDNTCQIGWGNHDFSSIIYNIHINQKTKISNNAGLFTVIQDDVTQNYDCGFYTFNNNLNIYIFTVNQNGSPNTQGFIGQLLYFKILDNNELIRNFIPCVRKSDGKPGLYDLCKSICPLTGTPFYINAGTGEFVTP